LLLLLLLTKRSACHLVQKLQGHVTHKKGDMFGRQRKKQEGQQRHQYEVANKYVFKCRLKVDSDDDDVTNDGRLFHARAGNDLDLDSTRIQVDTLGHTPRSV